MTMYKVVGSCSSVAIVACGIAATSWVNDVDAHHSAAMFDDSKCQTVTGTVRNLQWQYPHSWLWIIEEGATSADAIWGFELPEPGSLVRSSSWSQHALSKGDKVTVSFSPLHDGRHAGLANMIKKLGDGTILHGAPNARTCESQLWIQSPNGSPTEAIPKPQP